MKRIFIIHFFEVVVKNADSNKVCMTSTNFVKCDDCLPTLAISNTSDDIVFDASTTSKQQISHTIDNPDQKVLIFMNIYL